MGERALSAVFMAHVDGAARASLAEVVDLEARLGRMLAACRAAWPALRVADESFLRHVARHLQAGTANALDGLHATDLYLALACAEGDIAALAELDRVFAREISASLSRMVPSGAQRDDIAQIVREKLLVSTGERPKIADYSGRGPLTGWLRVAAVRTAVSIARRKEPAAGGALANESLLDVPASLGDPELDHIRTRYKDDFKAAFQEALSSLSAQDRNILRLNLVDGLNIEQIGAIYRVHRATVARWIARSRDTVRDETRRILAARLHLEDREFDSLVGILQSQLDVSIHRILQQTDD